jgi:methyl-accepting chemotaxis protein
MVISAVIVSGAIIGSYNLAVNSDHWREIGSGLELIAIIMLPYMISAVVAATTAIGILALLPWIRLPEAVHAVQARLREMAAGDLSSRIRIQGNSVHARQLARELNCALGDLAGVIARWKLLDRAQWDLAEAVRIAAARKDYDEIARQIELIEKNFEKIGELHEQLIT